jgi:hypothetical protein
MKINDHLVETLDAFDELSLIAHPAGLKNLSEHCNRSGLAIFPLDSVQYWTAIPAEPR